MKSHSRGMLMSVFRFQDHQGMPPAEGEWAALQTTGETEARPEAGFGRRAQYREWAGGMELNLSPLEPWGPGHQQRRQGCSLGPSA